jgi:glyoxylase-like metal-dependent hydrolase (beta-lactamase superfamily II)
MKFLTTIFLFTISIFAFDYHLKSYIISDGVECFFGLSSTANKTNGGNTINSCYISTDDGFVVIDSGPTYGYAQQAYRVMQNKRHLPVKYVINTSADEIHLLGNEFYRERGATLIGPKGYDKSSRIKLSNSITADTFTNTRLTSLDKKIDSDYTITVGGVDISIKKAIKGSDRYLVVNASSRDIIFVGDILSHNRIPILEKGRSLQGWIDALKMIEKSSWSRIISAHGIRNKRSAIKSTKSYLQTLKKRVTESIKKGIDKEKAIETIKMSSFKEERLYDEWHKKNIAVAYNELEKIVKEIPLTFLSLPVSPQLKEKEDSKKILKAKVEKRKPEVKKRVVKVKKPEIKKRVVKAKKTEVKKRTPRMKRAKRAKREKREKIPPITTYYSYETAKYFAKKDKKILMIKVRSNHSPFSDELDGVMQGSRSIRKVMNQNYKMVYLNVSMEKLPLGIKVRRIPSLILIRPDTQKVVMVISGFKTVGELLNRLKAGVKKGKRGGYLK